MSFPFVAFLSKKKGMAKRDGWPAKVKNEFI
jgi:hypothetical protein